MTHRYVSFVPLAPEHREGVEQGAVHAGGGDVRVEEEDRVGQELEVPADGDVLRGWRASPQGQRDERDVLRDHQEHTRAPERESVRAVARALSDGPSHEARDGPRRASREGVSDEQGLEFLGPAHR